MPALRSRFQALAGGKAGSGIGGTGIDAGIGGTGIESGIGGTGIFGLIEGFSSIWVNDVKVEIPSSAHITLNGQPAGESDLTLGQTVAIEAFEAADGSLQASRIDASLALVGPIDHMDQGRGRWALSILGQKVIVSSLTDSSALGIGDWVVVTGLRDHRGHIQAANIQPTSRRDAVITGAVSSDGTVAGDLGFDVGGSKTASWNPSDGAGTAARPFAAPNVCAGCQCSPACNL